MGRRAGTWDSTDGSSTQRTGFPPADGEDDDGVRIHRIVPLADKEDGVTDGQAGENLLRGRRAGEGVQL